MLVKRVKTFKINQNFSDDTDFIWDRRKDLHGCKIRVNYFEDYPHLMIANESAPMMYCFGSFQTCAI